MFGQIENTLGVADVPADVETLRQAVENAKAALNVAISNWNRTMWGTSPITARFVPSLENWLAKNIPETDNNTPYSVLVWERMRVFWNTAGIGLIPIQKTWSDMFVPFVEASNNYHQALADQKTDDEVGAMFTETLLDSEIGRLSNDETTAVLAGYYLGQYDPNLLNKIADTVPEVADLLPASNEAMPLNGIGKSLKKAVNKLGAFALLIPGASEYYLLQKGRQYFANLEDRIKSLELNWKTILFAPYYLLKVQFDAIAPVLGQVTKDVTRALKKVIRYTNPFVIAFRKLAPQKVQDEFAAWEKKHRKTIKIVGAIAAVIATMGASGTVSLQSIITGLQQGAADAWTWVVNNVTEAVGASGGVTGAAKELLKKEAQSQLEKLGKDGVRKLMEKALAEKGQAAIGSQAVIDLTTPPVGLDTGNESTSINWKVLLPLVGTAAMVMGN